LIEVAEVVVFLWLDEGEGAGELTDDGDLAGGCNRFGTVDGMLGPGDFVVFRRAFDGEDGGQVIDDLVADLLVVLHIDRLQPLLLIDKRMDAASLEEEAGEEKTLGSCTAEIAVDVDDSDEIDIRIVDADEVIEMSLDSLRDLRLEGMIELLFDLVEVVTERGLTPAKGFLAGHYEAESAGDGALRVEGDVAGADGFVFDVGLARRGDHEFIATALAEAGGQRVPPVSVLKGHIFSPGSSPISFPPVLRARWCHRVGT
jgi:hypothetical protein